MSKRDTYRDEPDWDIVSQAFDAQRQAAIADRDMRELMMPSSYERTKKCHGRTKHY